MANSHRLTALALARAMLAGPPTEAGLRARLWACLDTQAAWCQPLAQGMARIPGEQWQRLSVRALASLVERHEAYQNAWKAEGEKPSARRYILRVASAMQPPRLGLAHCLIPNWPHTAALAEGLGISIEGLWRLTRPTAWQRRSGLGEQHYRYRLLAKRSGGWRLLEVPEPYLMALQRRLLDDLLDRIPPHQAACGFRRERSVLDHARAHMGQAVVLRFDLLDFFATVRSARVQALFKTLGYSDEVARDLSLLCTTATPEPVLQRMGEEKEGGLSWLQRQRLRDAHLPQGAPTSAALANLCAFRLDLRLQGLADSLGARYTRYADDLVLSGAGHLRAAADRIEAWVGRIAREEGFALNHRKTRCLPTAQRQLVCHIVVNQKLNLPRAEFDRLKAILHRCVHEGPASQNREGKPDWQAHLQGRVAWAAQLNPAKARRLQGLLARIDWGV